MIYLWMGLGSVILALAGTGYWLWQRQRFGKTHEVLSAVSRQHIDLYNGGGLDEAELEATKEKYNRWLYQEEIGKIRASLVPGLHYVVRVRALAELGTEEACAILEHELTHSITDDDIEQSWYWIDVAHCLRMLAREESLPLLLRRLKDEDDFPLVHFYAAELVTFSRFGGMLKEFPDPIGQAAVRALHRALEGLRCGISPQLVAEARLGEMVEILWDFQHHLLHPLLIRLFAEALRHLRRAQQFASEMAEEAFEQEAYLLQISHLSALEPSIQEYLDRAKLLVPQCLEHAKTSELHDWFGAVQELRADAGSSLVQLLRHHPNLPLSEYAVLALSWSKSAQAAAYLRETAARYLMGQQKRKRWQWFASKPVVHQSRIATAALVALRHHPSMETEQLLLAGARSSDPAIKAAAISSLGWWEPLRRNAVLMYLQDARFDHDGDVRQAARSALARLGERQALQWFRQGLSSSNREIVVEAIHAIAQDGITLLWPELDRLVDEEEYELASCAREALEQMQEELEREHNF
jgi:HEAT repeat protein